MCVFLSVLGPLRHSSQRKLPQCMAVGGGGGVCWFQSVTAANWITVCFSAVADSRLMWFLQLPKTNWSGLIHSPHKEKDREVQGGGGVVWMRFGGLCLGSLIEGKCGRLILSANFGPQCRNRELQDVWDLAVSAYCSDEN